MHVHLCIFRVSHIYIVIDGDSSFGKNALERELSVCQQILHYHLRESPQVLCVHFSHASLTCTESLLSPETVPTNSKANTIQEMKDMSMQTGKHPSHWKWNCSLPKIFTQWSVSQNHVLLEPQNLSLEAGQTELLEQMGLLTDINLPTSNEIQSLISDSTLFDWFCTAYFLSHWKMKIYDLDQKPFVQLLNAIYGNTFNVKLINCHLHLRSLFSVFIRKIHGNLNITFLHQSICLLLIYIHSSV